MSCFEFDDYRAYLETRLPTSGAERGLRSRLAKALRCQSAYISRVLGGETNFSLEHASQICLFLGHGDLEKEYFLLLVSEARAGTKDLRDFYRGKRAELREKNLEIAERIKVKKGLTSEDQATYYSSWHYAAVHVMLTVAKFRTASAIANQLQLPLNQVQKILEFLEGVGLARQEKDHYVCGEARIHIGRDSPMLPKHHTNWRVRAIHYLDRSSDEDLFFSGPISVSEADAAVVREKLLHLLEEVEPLLRYSQEEGVFCLNMDFFRL